MKNNKVLLITNMQYDFMPEGSLEIKNGNKIIPIINDLLPKFELIIFLNDWHPKNHESFSSQWPNKKAFEKIKLQNDDNQFFLLPDHCVKHTRGADIHRDIDFGAIKKDFYFFKLGTKLNSYSYSGFYNMKLIDVGTNKFNKLLISTDLEQFLKNRGIKEVFVSGLTLDSCVKNTSIDAAKSGFDTYVIEDATKPIDPNINKILKDFKTHNIKLIESFELEQLN